MSEHYKSFTAVFPVIIRTDNDKRQVLLSRRANTGYMDGMWDFAGSGHVDEGETAMQAVIRESKEELGITVNLSDISFIHLSHRLGKNGNRTYYDMYFSVESYFGKPIIAEPEKCSELEWFDLDNLPIDMIAIRKDVLELYLKSIYYSEIIME